MKCALIGCTCWTVRVGSQVAAKDSWHILQQCSHWFSLVAESPIQKCKMAWKYQPHHRDTLTSHVQIEQLFSNHPSAERLDYTQTRYKLTNIDASVRHGKNTQVRKASHARPWHIDRRMPAQRHMHGVQYTYTCHQKCPRKTTLFQVMLTDTAGFWLSALDLYTDYCDTTWYPICILLIAISNSPPQMISQVANHPQAEQKEPTSIRLPS